MWVEWITQDVEGIFEEGDGNLVVGPLQMEDDEGELDMADSGDEEGSFRETGIEMNDEVEGELPKDAASQDLDDVHQQVNASYFVLILL